MTYGPIDFLALEFKNERLKGEILPTLIDLVENKVVRVIDLVIVQKYEDGRHEAVEMQQLAPDMLSVFDPLEVQISGIIQVEDIEAIADGMANSTTAALMLFENLWANKFKEAVLNADGRLLMQERIPYQVVEEVLETFAKAE